MTQHLLAATVDLPSFDKEHCVDVLSCVPVKYWFYDKYRHTTMLPLMSMGGKEGMAGASNFREKQPYEWLPYAPKELTDWFNTYVFPWMGMRARVSLLRTQPDQRNHVHIDCSPRVFGTRQHKFRVLLQGRTDTLYFVTKSGDKKLFDTDKPFIMDGAWPHGMHNFTDDEKYTIAVGSPWDGNDVYANISNEMFISSDELPADYAKYFDTMYK